MTKEGHDCESMAEVTGSFCYNLLYHDRLQMAPELEKEIGAKYVKDINEMLPQCNVVVVNMPLTEKTRGLFNKELIVNNARGAISCSASLCCFGSHTVWFELHWRAKLSRSFSHNWIYRPSLILFSSFMLPYKPKFQHVESRRTCATNKQAKIYVDP
ncbi:PREDICTED: formate dehydrogenase 1, mitochondrial-like isoform X3 [Camelina sativa]|uniref:Formate dehydrogenase 1, mitochondrial-like isoform X3 n=1 Tax=Camelina sativa TaxID=90675 RepID=A0ABM0UDN9_CAMSA|nr:PREDICTED: formate dehydrogenase 1, mitochondrial-like isoform X3 [Camelina sativa]